MQTEVHTGQIGLGFMDQIERYHGCLLGLAIGMLWVQPWSLSHRALLSPSPT